MNLSKFAELISLNDSNVAKNTLSYLIGNGQRGEEWAEALAELYMAFPKEIKESKQDKKIFLPIIIKYFFKYSITKKYIEIYNNYESLISSKDKDIIKSNNPEWNWDEKEEIIFKNTNDFAKALAERSQWNNRYKFIEKYQSQFDNFLKNNKDKERLLFHFENKRIWGELIKENYIEFVALCNKLNVNRLEILKDDLKCLNIDTVYFSDDKLNMFEKYLDDIYEIKDTFEDLIPKNQYYKKNKNIFEILLRTINSKDYMCAIKFLEKFKEEFTEFYKIYDLKFEMEMKSFKELIDKKIKLSEHTLDSDERNEKFLLSKVSENYGWFKFLANYELGNELDMSNKKVKKQIKI